MKGFKNCENDFHVKISVLTKDEAEKKMNKQHPGVAKIGSNPLV